MPRELAGPQVPIPAYSGIILNLFTNALKALVAAESSIDEPTIVFRGWNEPKRHYIEILDNGVGIPPTMRKRIWDPLYTTTADPANPLGSGMGLGLSLVKQVATEFGGSMLDDLVADGDVEDGRQLASHQLGQDIPRSRCCEDASIEAGYFCMLSEKPVSFKNSVGGLAWFPRGADLARISRSQDDELGAWLS